MNVNLTVQPVFVEHDGDFHIAISGQANDRVWVSLGDKTFMLRTDDNGNATITIDAKKIAPPSNSLQQVRAYLSGENGKLYDSGVSVQILPRSVARLAVASQSLTDSELQILHPTEIDAIAYPSSGVGETESATAKKVTTSGDLASESLLGDFARVNSFSACRITPNAGLVVVASQDASLLEINNVTDEREIARARASRAYVSLTQLGTQYSAPYRTARVIELDATINDCTDGIVAIAVDADIWNDSSLKKIWVLDGGLAGRQFKILTAASELRLGERLEQYIWYITPTTSESLSINNGDCFSFVAYGDSSSISALQTNLSDISPLPYIEVNGYAVSTVNPQITSNPNLAPDEASQYIYVVAEGNVGGIAQLFLYSFNIKSGSVYGWKQLTFDGENKNARIHSDGGNLHIVWESSRCQPNQLYYGVLGPKSRPCSNETFISAIDKQSARRVEIKQDVFDDHDLSTSIVDVNEPTDAGEILNLRPLDEYGAPYGEMWTPFMSAGGDVDIIDDGSVTISGNPSSAKFAAFACLQRDQDDVDFTSEFSQLSYQVSFDLDIDSGKTTISREGVNDLYKEWKAGYDIVETSAKGSSVYSDSGPNGQRMTLGGQEYIYDKMIPIVGSYKAVGLCGDENYGDLLEQLRLRHFMLAIVPERVRFLATSAETPEEYEDRIGSLVGYENAVEEIHYTGLFKLALLTETSANISDIRLAGQYYHIIRLFGESFDINEKHNYKVSVHYSKLREEQIEHRRRETIEVDAQKLRFSGNIIVTIDGKTQCGENFICDFSDEYNQFDIGFGVSMLAEYRPFNVKPVDGTINDDIDLELSYTNIAVGKHTVVPNPFITHFGKVDRNVDKMFIGNLENALYSMNVFDEIYGTDESGLTQLERIERYSQTFGLDKDKVQLSQIPITFSGKNAGASLFLDNQGKAHVAFQSNRDGNWEIYYTNNIDSMLPFRFDTRITDSDQDSLMPSVSVDQLGRRLITWHDNRNGTFQIYAARSTKTQINTGECARKNLLEKLGFEDEGAIPDEYEYFEDFASICKLSFIFTAPETGNFHFISSFYHDSERTSLSKMADSRFDISNWFYISSDGEILQIPYNGISVEAGDSFEIFYDIHKEDGLTDSIYYVTIMTDNGSDIVNYRTVEFFCPIGQQALCNVPILYTNDADEAKEVNFLVEIFADEDEEQTVMTSDTSESVVKWYIGGREPFPADGIIVQPNETVSLSFNPEILSLNSSRWQNAATISALLCNTKYYVRVTASTDEGSSVIDSFAIECDCSEVGSNIWREDTVSKDWSCSGQGGMDIRLTDGSKPSLYPVTTASQDGIFYIAWEDLRNSENEHLPDIYFTVWDANSDIFYSRSQGYFDKLVIEGGYFKPQILMNGLQHVVFIHTNGKGVYRKTLSLYQEPSEETSETVDQTASYLIQPNTLGFTEDDLNGLSLDVHSTDIVRLYHQTSDTPMALVNKCRVRFDIRCPHGTYAIRFKNESDTEYCDWIPVLPKFYGQTGSPTPTPLSNYLQAYSVSDSHIVADWILSKGNGNKVVYCELMTYFGKTPAITRNIIARYRPLNYRVRFYTTDVTVPASLFRGYPVISTKSLEVIEGQVNSITSTAASTSTITVYVEFDEPDYLAEIIEMSQVDRFGDGSEPDLTFNVILPGKTLRNLPLTAVADTSVSFDYNSPPASASAVKKGVYKGSFTIEKADGFDNKDGLAAIVVNIPSPCHADNNEEILCEKERKTISDLQSEIAEEVNAIPVEQERFRLLYRPDMLGSFTTLSCVDGDAPEALIVDDNVFPPDHPGPVGCDEQEWTVAKRAEPCFFARRDLNATRWFVESQEFEFDFSDERIDYLKFSSDSYLDDILIMVKPNETITYTPTLACGETGNAGATIFTIPSSSVVFHHSEDNYYCHGSSECNNSSAAKTFRVSSTTLISIPDGASYDGTDGGASWTNIDTALGKTYNILSPPTQNASTGCLIATFENGIAKAELENKGFITTNGVLRFKFIHIASGTGEVSLRGVTCGATCEEV